MSVYSANQALQPTAGHESFFLTKSHRRPLLLSLVVRRVRREADDKVVSWAVEVTTCWHGERRTVLVKCQRGLDM